MWYNARMRFGKRHRFGLRAVAAFAAAVVGFAAVARGAELCLCEDDPDGCGHACHECGAPMPDGFTSADSCHHLDFDCADLSVSDTSVALPEVPALSVAVEPLALSVRRTGILVPCATAPPGLTSYGCSRLRLLCPRS